MLIYLQLIDSESDKNKFTRIYELYSGMMYNVAYKRLGNKEDAEDAVHQAFLNIIDLLKKINSPESRETKALMIIITTRRAVDIIRYRSRFESTNLNDSVADTDFIDRLNGELPEAMSRLPARYSRALLLKFGYGYNTAEVAKMMGIKVDAMRKLIWRAKEALKEELEKEKQDE